jgi:acetolactate synthase-1/2/3 large subunit
MTAADVLLDALVRAGTGRLFVAPGIGLDHPLLVAARARACPVTRAAPAAGAVLMAAVTGEIGDGPGFALVPSGAEAADAVAYAARNRAPLVVARETPPVDAAAARDDSLTGWMKGAVVIEAESAGHWAAHACQLALGFPPGPVHVTWPSGALTASAVPIAAAVRPAPPPAADPSVLDDLARRLAAASRPVLIAGLHARGEADTRWLRALAEALPAPVLVTLKARGVVADPHPLVLGSYPPGAVGAQLLRQADLVVTVGVEGAEIDGVAPPAAPVLAITRAAGECAGLRPALEVAGDIALVIEELAPRLRGRAGADWDFAALDRMKRAMVSSVAAGNRAAALVRAAREATPAGSAAAADARVMAAVADGWQSVAPHDLLTALPPAPPGFAVAAAVAFALARPGHPALAFTDAAGAAAAPDEIATAVAARIPLALVVLNPGRAQLSVALTPIVVEHADALGPALTRTIVTGLPSVIDCRV